MAGDERIPYWWEVTEPDPSSPEDLRVKMDTVAARSGFLPNIFVALSYFPDEFRAFFAFHDSLMSRDSRLTKAEREAIVVSTSAANGCTYCVVAHGAILRVRAKHPFVSDQVAIDFEAASISERAKRILRFAHKISLHPQAVTPADFAPLYEIGLDDGDIWLAGAIAAFFAMSNRLAGLGHIMPNNEFYHLGRDIDSGLMRDL